jgi:hypothetical protein
MNTEPIKEVLNELFSHLERLETQSNAILQFLKEKKRVTDKQLAPYLEQAGNASNVRWRAARVRIEHLLSSTEDKEKEIVVSKAPEIAMAEQKTNTAQATPADDKQPEQADKSAAASADKQTEAEASQQPSPKADAPTQGKGEQSGERKEESSHPTEMTEEVAQREGAEPPPDLSPEKNSGEKKSDEKEAA